MSWTWDRISRNSRDDPEHIIIDFSFEITRFSHQGLGYKFKITTHCSVKKQKFWLWRGDSARKLSFQKPLKCSYMFFYSFLSEPILILHVSASERSYSNPKWSQKLHNFYIVQDFGNGKVQENSDWWTSHLSGGKSATGGVYVTRYILRSHNGRVDHEAYSSQESKKRERLCSCKKWYCFGEISSRVDDGMAALQNFGVEFDLPFEATLVGVIQ